MPQSSTNQKTFRFKFPSIMIKTFSFLILLGGLAVWTISLEAQEEKKFGQAYLPAVPSLEKYAQIYLPPVSYVPPVVIGPTVTTYYNPPVWVNNYPPVVMPGPVIVRTPWRPFLRTFIP